MALLAAVIACEALGWPFLRGPLQRAAERSAGVPVQVGERFRIHLMFDPRLTVDRLSIGAAPGFELPHLVAGSDVEMAWRWGELRRWQQGQGPLTLRRLEAATLDANLVRRADGTASWSIGSGQRAPRAEGANPALPEIGTVSIGSGRIVLDDRLTSTDLRIDVQGGEVRLANAAGAAGVAPGASAVAAAPASAPASAPSRESETVAASRGYRANVKGTYRALPLDLRVTAGALLPLAQGADAGNGDKPGVPVRVEGSAGSSQIVFDGRASALFSARRIEGNLRFRGPSLAQVGEPLGLTLPRTAPFDLTGQLAHDAGVWRLAAERFTLGRSRLAGNFVYDANAKPGRLTGTLNGAVLALADLGPAIGARDRSTKATPVSDEPAAAPGRVLPQRRFDIPSLRAMNADVQVAIDQLDFGSRTLAPVTALRAHVRLDAGVLRLDDLQGNVAGGRLTGATRYDGNPQLPRWDADLRFDAVDVAGWIRGVQSPAAAKAPAPKTSAKALRAERTQARADAQAGSAEPARAYLTGALSSEVKVHGSGRSTSEILGTLQGRAQGTIRDGTMSHLVTELLGLDVAETLGVLIRGDRALPLRCARVDLAIERGVATPKLAVFDNRDSTIFVDGTVNLRDETLALRAISRSKDFSPLSLRGTVTISGTLADPNFGIDASRLAGRAAAAAVLGAVAPIAALLPFIDRGSKQPDPCAR